MSYVPLFFAFLSGLLSGLMFYHVGNENKCLVRDDHPTSLVQRSSKPLQPVRSRDDLSELIIREGFTSGAEVGVQVGLFSEILLRNWAKCTEFHAIDLWGIQANYKDQANQNTQEQENRFQATKTRLKAFNHIVHYHRNYSNLAVKELADDSLDFIYIDARHDYTGCMQDMILYWPKLRVGGIFAGHDYWDTAETKGKIHPDDDWSIDQTGKKRSDNKAVRSAVNEFAQEYNRQIIVTYTDYAPSWYMRK